MERGIRGSCFEMTYRTQSGASENKLKMEEIDFIADLEYLTTVESGRKTPAAAGYRPHIAFYGYPEYMTSGTQHFLDKELVYSGDSVKAGIKILATEYFKGRLHESLSFSFFEGSRMIGKGIISQIVNNDLKLIDITTTAAINLNFYPEDIIQQVIKDFKEDSSSVITKLQEFIIEHEYYRSPRIVRAIIALSEKDKNKLIKYIKAARTDWRDVLYWGEYKKINDSETIRIKNFNNKFGEEMI